MNEIDNKFNKLHKFIKEKGIYNFFTYKYFISDNFQNKNPPLFYIDNNYKNHFNMLIYQLIIRNISKHYNIKNIKSIASIDINNEKLTTINYIYQYLINKNINNYITDNFNSYLDNFKLVKNKFNKKVDLLFTTHKDLNKIFNYLNKNSILIIYYEKYNKELIEILKKKFRSIQFYKVLDSISTYYLICYYYDDKYEMKNNIFEEYINQLNKDFNIINNEINQIKNKSKKDIMYFYLKKLLRKIDQNQLQINPYYRKTFYYDKWNERIKIDTSKELQILEIGVYKGEMSIWFINNLLKHKNSRINLVDTWKGSVEYNEDFDKVYEEYKKNIKYSKYPEKAIENRMTSLEYLAKHIIKYPKPYFDIIFIDACHDSRCVMTDAMLSWKVLKVGGYLVFDDYGWNLLRDKPDYVRPKMSIDCFLNLFRDDIKIIHKGYKVFLRKIKEYQF